jgi:hypothetical protein
MIAEAENGEALAIDDSRARTRLAKLVGVSVPERKTNAFEEFYGLLDRYELDRKAFDASELVRDLRRR